MMSGDRDRPEGGAELNVEPIGDRWGGARRPYGDTTGCRSRREHTTFSCATVVKGGLLSVVVELQ